jgi:hypothetical protein
MASFQGDHAEQQAAGSAQQQDLSYSTADSVSSRGTSSGSGLTQVDPLEEQLQQLLRLWQQAARAASDNATGAVTKAASEAPDAAGDAAGEAAGLPLLITLHFREVVEVKNHCPFRFRWASCAGLSVAQLCLGVAVPGTIHHIAHASACGTAHQRTMAGICGTLGSSSATS